MVAKRVGSTSEVVFDRVDGRVDERNAAAIAAVIDHMPDTAASRIDVHADVEGFGCQQASYSQLGRPSRLATTRGDPGASGIPPRMGSVMSPGEHVPEDPEGRLSRG